MNAFNRQSIPKWPLLTGLAIFLSLLNIGINVTEDLAEGLRVELTYYLVNEFTGVFLIFALFPLLWLFFKRFPPTRFRLWQTILVYLGVSILLGAVHTTLMYLVRLFLYDWMELGDYSLRYGILSYRYAYEYFKQFLFFGVAFLFFLYTVKWEESQEQKVRAARLEQQLTQSRMQFLQMQINPHFLFNTLNMISSELYSDPKKADKMIALLSDLLRTTLSQPDSGKHTFEKELEIANRYLQIMEYRFGNRLTVSRHIEEEALSALLPVFLLQPILENAIKYSIDSQEKALVGLSAKKSGNRFEITITDNGPGLTGHAGKGIGLHNTLERLEQVYRENAEVSLQNQAAGGLAVQIRLPYEVLEKQPDFA